MARFNLSIKLEQRKNRALFIRFLDFLELFLRAGFEMTYAWERASQILLRETKAQSYFLSLLFQTHDGLSAHLLKLSQEPQMGSFRPWFQVLKQLYEQGAGMVEVVEGLGEALQQEEKNDLESHLRQLPTKLQILLILFFFPPTVLLLILPLLSSLNSIP